MSVRFYQRSSSIRRLHFFVQVHNYARLNVNRKRFLSSKLFCFSKENHMRRNENSLRRLFIDSYARTFFFPLTVQFSNLNDAFRLTELGIQLSAKSFEPLQRFESHFAWMPGVVLNHIIRCSQPLLLLPSGKFNQQSFNYRLRSSSEMHMLLLSAPVDLPRQLSN